MSEHDLADEQFQFCSWVKSTMVSARVLVLGIFFGVLAVCQAQRSSLDAVDIDAVFKNERLLKIYVDCILDKRPCSREGAELKERLPNILRDNCATCSPQSTERAVKVVQLLSTKKPEMWKQVKAKYDPTGERSAEFGKHHNLSL